MQDTFYRNTWAEVNLEAIGYNITQMKQKLPAETRIIAVVKADGYGHGAIEVAKKAVKTGASAIAVALLEEAIVLRHAGISVPILVFGWVSPQDTPLAADYNLTLTFFQMEWLQEVKDRTFQRPLKLHMKWDTGMGRLGIRTEKELKQLLDELAESPNTRLTGIYTHFATADAADLTYYDEQQKRFQTLLQTFRKRWRHPVAIHIGNSAASIRFPEDMFQFTRLGIAMYGLYPSKTVKQERKINLKQAFSLYSRLIHVKKIQAGESISYGTTYTAKEDEWIGTIPIGYADGWIRKLQGMEVLVNGKRMPIVGRICMDQTMLRLDKAYPVGSKVTLIGKQGNEEITMDEVAAYLDTINYEIPCIITSRVPRVYKVSES
ncbi:alanine racemase 1 [Lentibacillus populi]|uniref:Alanine racemase n=1 Tax=Lentibacillus populi TaxID=1827502 RepID=A0A9W5U0G7_9BACI|nr:MULTISPECIES: alanine racemase [Bacillaceae]GGB55546.1 alanine racemase 1 [Lentibacillus populi]